MNDDFDFKLNVLYSLLIAIGVLLGLVFWQLRNQPYRNWPVHRTSSHSATYRQP